MPWYVVAENCDADPEEKVWTLSRDPNEPGWNTDSGFRGYGLIKADAEELASAANLAEMKPRELSLIEKLRDVANLRPGDPPPPWMGGPSEWGPPLSKLCKEAAQTIEALQADPPRYFR